MTMWANTRREICAVLKHILFEKLWKMTLVI